MNNFVGEYFSDSSDKHYIIAKISSQKKKTVSKKQN